MAHYVIKLGSDTLAIGDAWSERDAIEMFYDKTSREWNSGEDLIVDSIRPATVREAMIAEYGDTWAAEDFRSGISHAATVVNSYRTENKDVLIIAFARANDVHGYDDAVNVSNYRVLYDRWSHLDGLTTSTWSNVDSIGLVVDSEAPADLTEVINGLCDYPVIDNDERTSVEQEMIDEHWDSYGKSDLVSAVQTALGDDAELTEAGEDIITRLVFEGILDYGDGCGYPIMIDSSMCDFGTKEVTAFIVENIGKTVQFDRYSDTVSLDLTRSNFIREETEK
jgi:hypothetical protein